MAFPVPRKVSAKEISSEVEFVRGFILCVLSAWEGCQKPVLGGGFKDFLFSPLPGEMIQFD